MSTSLKNGGSCGEQKLEERTLDDLLFEQRQLQNRLTQDSDSSELDFEILLDDEEKPTYQIENLFYQPLSVEYFPKQVQRFAKE